MTTSLPTDRAARGLLGVGFLAAWWIAYYPLPFPEFYKEWVFAMALGLCAVVLGPGPDARTMVRHPLVLAALAAVGVLLLQAVAFDGAWTKALMMAAYAGFFATTIVVGTTLAQQRPADSLIWLARLVLVAALGNCFFGALQLNWIEFAVPLVAPRSPARITSNLAQANHFADLLWLGVVSAAYLHARMRLGTGSTWLALAVLIVFSLFTGSRMVWLYAGLVSLLGAVVLVKRPAAEPRRLATTMLAVGVATVVLALLLSVSGAAEFFGIVGSGERVVSGEGQGSSRQRWWFWRAGIDAALSHPFLGVGAGHYVGHAHELAMSMAEALPRAADSNAHNLFIHLAAELGIPLALLVAVCLLVWLLGAWRRIAKSADALAVLALAGVILVHANLEYPLWFAYFLGLFGLLVGHLPGEGTDAPDGAQARSISRAGQWAGMLVLVTAGLAYQQHKPLESAMQQLVGQVGMGAAPQQSPRMADTLEKLSPWSPYRDHGRAVRLITAKPTAENADSLSAECESALRVTPSPYLMARCATVLQVAGHAERATYFANGICKLYPRSVGTLIQSMTYVEKSSPSVGALRSTCVERTP